MITKEISVYACINLQKTVPWRRKEVQFHILDPFQRQYQALGTNCHHQKVSNRLPEHAYTQGICPRSQIPHCHLQSKQKKNTKIEYIQ